MQTTVTIESDVIPVVKSSLALKHRALEFNQRQYLQRLSILETKHQMNSEEFKKKFKAGELGDDPEWFDWEYILDAYQDTIHQLDLLESVKL
ncbi:MAG: hypothetical protein AB1585_00625 [Thermodesulfobacteriota bacterium]